MISFTGISNRNTSATITKFIARKVNFANFASGILLRYSVAQFQ